MTRTATPPAPVDQVDELLDEVEAMLVVPGLAALLDEVDAILSRDVGLTS